MFKNVSELLKKIKRASVNERKCNEARKVLGQTL